MDKINLFNKILFSLLVVLALACITIVVKYTDKLAVNSARLEEIQTRYNSLTEEYERIRKTYEGLINEQNTNTQ